MWCWQDELGWNIFDLSIVASGVADQKLVSSVEVLLGHWEDSKGRPETCAPAESVEHVQRPQGHQHIGKQLEIGPICSISFLDSFSDPRARVSGMMVRLVKTCLDSPRWVMPVLHALLQHNVSNRKQGLSDCCIESDFASFFV